MLTPRLFCKSLTRLFSCPFSVHTTSLLKPVTLPVLFSKYQKKIPITMLTAQDYPSSLVCNLAQIDMILVGDSLAMTTLGHPTTLNVTMDEMIHHSKAVKRANSTCFLVGDMPFGSYLTPDDAIRTAARFIQEGDMNSVKLEGGRSVAHLVKRFTQNGIAVIGHIGLTPQHVNLLGGFKVFGAKELQEAMDLWEDAKALRDNGASLIVLECVPEKLAKLVTDNLGVPTIGIGSGPDCSGQVLVFNDLLGIYDKLSPKFCKKYLSLNEVMVEAVRSYKDEVERKEFPVSKKHTFVMKEDIFKKIEPIIKGDKSAHTITTKEKKEEEKKELSLGEMKNIVILGEGAVGSLMAATLKKVSSENMRNVRLVTKRSGESKIIKIKTNVEEEQGLKKEEDQDVEVFDAREVENHWSKSIDLLLICCKNYQTEGNLTRFLETLSKDVKIKCILTVQNGFGNLEKILDVFKAKNLHIPTILPISLYSGVKLNFEESKFKELTQSISQKILLTVPSILKDTDIYKLFTSPPFEIKQTISKSSIFKEKTFIDWEKLVINSIINPLTAILEVKNQNIINNPSIQALAKSLTKEIVQILKLVPGSLDWVIISNNTIEEAVLNKVLHVAKTTGSNTSSMLIDIQRKNMNSEIDSFNGAFVKISEELKLHENSYKLNKMIVDMVKAKTWN